MGFDVPRPIIEFFGIFVGVDPDQWPKGSESALRDYARQYEAIATQLRNGVGSQAKQVANSLVVAWNGEGGRALSNQITNYANGPDAGGVETIATYLDSVARHLRDSADEIFRHKAEMVAQAVIGAALFFIPGVNLISKIPGLKNLLANRFKNWLARRVGQIVSKLVGALASKTPKLPTAAVKVVRSNFAKNAGFGVTGATVFGLGPNTAAQVAGLMTDKDGRSVYDDQGNYVGHEEGWNGEETKTYLGITAAALPIAGAVGLGANALGNRMVPDPSRATAFVGRRLRGAAAMGVSLPAANYAVTGHSPTGEEIWRAAAMGGAMPTHPVKPLVDGIRGMVDHLHAAPLEPVRNFTEIVPGDRPPDPPPHGPVGVPAGEGAAHQTTTPMAPEARATDTAGVAAPGAVVGLHGAEAAHPSGRAAHADPSARTTPRTTTSADGAEATSAKPRATGQGDGSGRPPGGGHSTEVEGGGKPSSGREQTGKPPTGGEQTAKPATGGERDGRPVPAEEPTGRPVPAGEPTGKPVPAGEQHGKPVPAGEQHGRPTPPEESGPRTPGPEENLRAAERDRTRPEAPVERHASETRDPPAPARPEPESSPDHVGRSRDAHERVELTEHQQEGVRRAAAARVAEQAYFEIARGRDAFPAEAPQREARQSAKDFRAADEAVHRQEKAVDRAARDLEAARKDETKATKAVEKATRNAERSAERRADGTPDPRLAERQQKAEEAAGVARERTEAWQRELEQAGERLEAAEAKRAEAKDVAEARSRELEAWLEAEEKRLTWLVAERDYELSRLGPEQLKQLYQLELEGWGHFTPDEQRILAIHEMIHRRFHTALYPGQIKAALAAGADMLVQAPCGFGKTFAFVLATGTAAADHPVHLMTSQRNLAGRDHLTYREILEPLGVDVVLVDPNRSYAHPSRPTVYMGGADSFGWSMSGERQMRAGGHRVPGDHLMIDEVDGVAIDLATQRYTHSDGAAGRAGAETEAGVHLAKWALDSGAFDKRVDFGLSEHRSTPRMTLEGRQRLRELIGDDVEAVRHFDDLVGHLESDARQRWVERYREGRDYEVGEIHGEKRIIILNRRNDAPLIDPITLAEQRWPGVAKALEARHGLEVRTDPTHISEVTTQDVLGRYERMSGMSGTVTDAKQAMLDLYGDRFSEVIEIGEHNAPKRIVNTEQHYATWREKWSAMADQLIVEMVKGGDPSQGRPQLVLLPNEEITSFTRLLKQRLAERGVEQQVEVQVVDAKRQIEFANAGRYDAAMREAGQQTGKPGTITVGNRDLARGFDPKPDKAAFGGFEAPAPGSKVFTIDVDGVRLEPTEGGIHNRVGFRDPDSPRGTTQAVSRVGRQGAPGEATVYTSHQDSLFQNRSDALRAAVAYRDSAGVARRDAALHAYTEAVFTHGTGEAVGRAADALGQSEKSLWSGAYREYNESVEAAQLRAQESDVAQLREQSVRAGQERTVRPDGEQAAERVEHTAVPKAHEVETSGPPMPQSTPAHPYSRPDAGDPPLAGVSGHGDGSPSRIPEEWERRFDAELAAVEADSGVRLQPLADVRDRAEHQQQARNAVLDAIDRVESTVSNRAAVQDATAQVTAAQRRIDAARFATPPMRRQLRHAEAALGRARAVQRRAYLVLTREDGSVHRALLENDRGRPRYVHLNGQVVDHTVVLEGRPIDGGTVVRAAASDVVTVRALAVTGDLAPVGFPWRSLGGPTPSQHAGALDGPPISPLPYVEEVAAYFTRQLQEHGADGTVDPTELGQRLLSEYRQLISAEGEVVKLGGRYFRARLALANPRQVVTSVTPVEGVSASFPQVGHMQDRAATHTTRRVIGTDVPLGPVTVGGTLQWNTSVDLVTTAGVHAGLAVTNNRGPAYPIEYDAAWQLSPIDLRTGAAEYTTVISAENAESPGTLVVAVPDSYFAKTDPTHTTRLDEDEWRPARELPPAMRLEIVGRAQLVRELLGMLPEEWRADREVVEQVLDHVKELTDRFHDTVRTSGRGRAPEGYAFDLTVRGRPIAVVTVTGEVLRDQVELLGRPMKQIKEDVGVGQHSATANVTTGRTGTLNAGLSATRFLPRWLAGFVEKAVSLEVGGSRSRRRARGAGMSMTALRVKVDKTWPGDEYDTSFNQAYEIGTRFTVSVKKADGEQVGGPRVVAGSAKLVLSELEAYRYGLRVDSSAVKDNGEVRGTPRRKDAEGREIDLPFPAHLRVVGRDGAERGLGVGFGAVRNFSLDVPKALTGRSDALADAVRAEFPGGSPADGTATLREMVLQLLGAPADHRGRRRDQEIENSLNAERQLDEDSVRQLYDDLAQDGVRLTFQRFDPKGLDPRGLGGKLVGAEDLHVDLRLEQRIGEAEFLGLGNGIVAAELPIDMSSVGSSMLGERSRSLSGALKLWNLFAVKGGWSWSAASGVSAALRANRVRLLETKEGKEFAGWKVPHTLTATVTEGRGREVAKLAFEGSAETWMLTDLAKLSADGRASAPVLGSGASVAEVLAEHGEVIAVDSVGVRKALREAGPWLPGDIVDALSSNDFIRANLRGIADRGVTLEGATRGQADRHGRNLVVLPRTRWNATVGAELGEISLIGETDSVLGANIMLRLPTTETSSSRSSGWTAGASVGKSYAGDLTRTNTKGESVSTGSTFGVEDINLGLERRFAVNVPVTWVVESTRVTLGRGSIVGSPEVSEPRKVSGGSVVALISESELVDMYGRGVIDLPDREVARSLTRWRDGELSLADRPVVTRAALRLAERRLSVRTEPDLALLRSVLGQYDGHPYDRHPSAYLGDQRFCDRCLAYPDGRRETALSPERTDIDAVVAELRRLIDEHGAGRLPAASVESRRRGVPEWIVRGAGIGVAGIDEVELEGDNESPAGLDEHLRTVLEQAVGGIFDGVGGPVETGRPLGKLPNVDGMMSVLGSGERAHSHLRDAIGTEYPLLETEIPRSFVSLLRFKRRPGADHIRLTMRADLVSPESLAPDEYRRLAQRLGELGLPTAPENLGPALDNLFRYQAYGFLTAAIVRSRGGYWNGEVTRPVPGIESTFGMNRRTATSVGGSTGHSTPETQINVQSLFTAVAERLDLPIRLTLRAYRSDMREPAVEREVVGRMRVRQQADFEPVPQESGRTTSYLPIKEIPPDHVGYALDDGGSGIRRAAMRMLSDSEMLGRKAAGELKTYVVDRGPLAHDGLLISLRRLFSDAGATLTVYSRRRPDEKCTVNVKLEGSNPTAVRRADRVRLGQIHRREEKDGTKIGVRPPVPGQSMVEGKLYATFKAGLGAQAELAVTTWDGWRDEMSGDTEGAGVVVRLDYAAYLEGERRVNGTVRQRLRMPNAAHGRLYVLVYEKDLPAFESRYGRIEAAADAARTRDPELESRAPELSLEQLLESATQAGDLEPGTPPRDAEQQRDRLLEAVSTALRREVRELEPRPLPASCEVVPGRMADAADPVLPPLVGLTVDALHLAVAKRTALAGARGPADDLDERTEAVLRARELVQAAEDPAWRAEQILEAAVALREAKAAGRSVDAAREQMKLALLTPEERRQHFRHAYLRWQRLFPGRADDLDALGLVRDIAVRVGAEILLTVTEPDGGRSRYRVSPYVGGIVREDLTDQNERLEHATRDLIRQDAAAFLRAGRLRLDLAELLEESTATGLPFAEVVANARNVPAERAALAGIDIDAAIARASRAGRRPAEVLSELSGLAESERARWDAVLPELRQALEAAGFTGVDLARALRAGTDLGTLFANPRQEGGDPVAGLVRLKAHLADAPEGSSFSFEEIAQLFGFGRADLAVARRLEELAAFRQILIDAGLREFDPATARLLRNLAGELALRYGLFAPEQRRRVLEVCREWPAAAVATRPARPDPVEDLSGSRSSEEIPRLDEEHREQLDETVQWIVERYYHGVPIGHAYRSEETLDAEDRQRLREALWRFGVPYAARLASQLPGARFEGDLSAQNFRVEVADPNAPSARQQRWVDAVEAGTQWVPSGADGFFDAVFAVLREDGGRELERLRAEYGVGSPRQLREGLANAVGARPKHGPGARTLSSLIPDLAGLGLKPSGAVDQIRDNGAVGSPLYAHLPRLLAEHYGLRIAVCDEAGDLELHGVAGADTDPGVRVRLLRIADRHYMPVLGGTPDAPGRSEDREDEGRHEPNRPTVRTTDHLGRIDHLPQRVPGQHLSGDLVAEDRIAEIVRSAAGGDAVRLEGMRALLESPELRGLDSAGLSAAVESWAGLEYVELFRRLADYDVDVPGAPPLPASVRRPPSDWERAADVSRELLPLPSRMSSAGDAGHVARHDDNSGVYSIERDGVSWVVKLSPDSERHRAGAVAELDGIYGAALTGYGPVPYGLVTAELGHGSERRSYVGVAMAPVEGGFITTESTDPAARAEADRWRSAVTFDTVRQFEHFLRRLRAVGYRYTRDPQCFVDGDGNVRPVDFEGVAGQAGGPAGRAMPAGDQLIRFDVAGLRRPLLEAAVENGRLQAATDSRSTFDPGR